MPTDDPPSVSADDLVAFPENLRYGCVDCGSINHTTGDRDWCPVQKEWDRG